MQARMRPGLVAAVAVTVLLATGCGGPRGGSAVSGAAIDATIDGVREILEKAPDQCPDTERPEKAKTIEELKRHNETGWTLMEDCRGLSRYYEGSLEDLEESIEDNT